MTVAQTEISQLKHSWKELLDGLRIITTQTPSQLFLHLLYVPATKRNLGYGDEIMKDLTNYCDKHNLVLLLRPVDDYGIPVPVLSYFYGKHGLVWNNDEMMTREPLYWDEFHNTTSNQQQQPKITV